MKKNKQNLREMWDIFKCTNICIMGVLGEGKKRQRTDTRRILTDERQFTHPTSSVSIN